MATCYNGGNYYSEKDDKGRETYYHNDSGYAFERIYDDDWDKEIPAEVWEYMYGELVYHREYEDVLVNKPYDLF